MRKALIAALFLLLLLTPQLRAQHPEPVGEDLLRLEGTDAESGIHYTRLILLLRSQQTPADATPGDLPRFTMECREQGNKRSLHWLVRLDGSPDFTFQPPRVSTPAQPYPQPYPIANLKMRFEGYTQSGEFKRQWEVLPTGEFHYRNPGMGSNNLDDPRHFFPYLIGLPNMRIGFVKPRPKQPGEVVFAAKPLIDLVRKTGFCEP